MAIAMLSRRIVVSMMGTFGALLASGASAQEDVKIRVGTPLPDGTVTVGLPATFQSTTSSPFPPAVAKIIQRTVARPSQVLNQQDTPSVEDRLPDKTFVTRRY